MKYVIEVDEKTGTATLQIGDNKPVHLSAHHIRIEREPVVDEKKSVESGFTTYAPGPRGKFTVAAEIDYLLPASTQVEAG